MRPWRSARSLEDCLFADTGMARLSSHAAHLVRLQALLSVVLPPGLSRCARVANLKSGKLVIHADNGAVAAKLRQMAPSLEASFRTTAAEVTGLEIRVQGRSGNPSTTRNRQPAKLGDKAKRGLTSLESTLPQGSRLRLALSRLIERSKP